MKHLFLYVPRQMGQLGGGEPDRSSEAGAVEGFASPSCAEEDAGTTNVGGVGDFILSGVTELTSMQSGVGRGWLGTDIVVVVAFGSSVMCPFSPLSTTFMNTDCF